jgi:tRNA (mo5U34)-methyltransferase
LPYRVVAPPSAARHVDEVPGSGEPATRDGDRAGASGLEEPSTVEDLSRQIAELGPWFHNLHLPGGVQTAPDHAFGDFPAWKWAEIASHLPDDLGGWRVLDIGCNAGFYSFELARRGARVTAMDLNPFYLRQARWAARLLGMESQVRFEQMQVHELSRAALGGIDLVMFMGVFYHLRYPLLALDTIARLHPCLMLFQSLTMNGGEVAPASHADIDFRHRDALARPDWPQMAFLEHSFCGDATNWWVPNHAAVMALLRSAGFEVTARPGHEIYLCRPDAGKPVDALALEEWCAATGNHDGRSKMSG